jgi:uncharacterized protein YndB with AHSA1/START domain
MMTTAITPNQDTVVSEIFIAAPPERVFQALTDPTQTSQWWGQSGMYRITERKADFRKGGKYSSVGVGADGKSFSVEGEYLEIDPPRLLVHTWVSSWCGALKTVVRWELEPQTVHGLQHRGPQKVGTGTLVRVRHEGFGSDAKAAADHVQGWTRVLGWLQSFVEKGETVDSRTV